MNAAAQGPRNRHEPYHRCLREHERVRTVPRRPVRDKKIGTISPFAPTSLVDGVLTAAAHAGQARLFIGSVWADHDESHRHKQLSTGRARQPRQCRAASVPTDTECAVVAPPHAFAGGLPGDSCRPDPAPPKHPPSAASMSLGYPKNPPAPRLCLGTSPTAIPPSTPLGWGVLKVTDRCPYWKAGLAWLPERRPRRLLSPVAVGHTYPTSRQRGMNGCLPACAVRVGGGAAGSLSRRPCGRPTSGGRNVPAHAPSSVRAQQGLCHPRASVAPRSLDCGVGEAASGRPRSQPSRGAGQPPRVSETGDRAARCGWRGVGTPRRRQQRQPRDGRPRGGATVRRPGRSTPMQQRRPGTRDVVSGLAACVSSGLVKGAQPYRK